MKILSTNIRYYPTHIWHDGVDSDSESIKGWSKNPPAVVTVLVEWDIGDYAAYTGLGSPEWVAANGDKISFEEAKVHFPIGLKKELYRS